MKGYQPPFRNKAADTAAKKSQEPKPRKQYSLEFVFSLRNQNKQRPINMALLDFPHKKKGTNVNGFRKKPLTEQDKFNKMVGEIRILLNKLSLSNFDTIQHQLLHNFTYTPSLLYQLMKMIFSKSTGEHAYLDVYVKLCSVLFKKFSDKENNEMNFKKLLVNKCQKQFNKMLNMERQERKKRRDSLVSGDEKKDLDGKHSAEEAEFSKPMMYLYDEEELKERQKEQMYGNMFLITELYIGGLLNGIIIKTCLEELQQEIND